MSASESGKEVDWKAKMEKISSIELDMSIEFKKKALQMEKIASISITKEESKIEGKITEKSHASKWVFIFLFWRKKEKKNMPQRSLHFLY